MNIIKTDWKWNGALSKRSSTEYIVLHHAEASKCSAQQVDEWHKNNGWSGIGYHFFVRKNGSIYEGRPLWALGAHVQGMNHCSIGICAEGAYTHETMPQAQKIAIAQLIDYLKSNYYPDATIVGHREIGDSDCPGKNYPLNELKNYKNLLSKGGDEAMTSEEKKRFDILEQEVNELKNPMIYNYVDNNMPEWAREGVQYCIDHGIISGTGNGLGLDNKDLKYCTMIMRLMKSLDK